MHHFTLTLATLAGIAISAPTPAPQHHGLTGPDFNVLTCQAQSIVVKTDWNTAFVTSDPAYTKYGEATQVVPLNGCADLSATFNAYFSNATPDGASMWSSIKCTIKGAPKGPNAQLHITPEYPFHELDDADGVTVDCANHDDVPGGGYEEPEQGEGEGEGEEASGDENDENGGDGETSADGAEGAGAEDGQPAEESPEGVVPEAGGEAEGVEAEQEGSEWKRDDR